MGYQPMHGSGGATTGASGSGETDHLHHHTRLNSPRMAGTSMTRRANSFKRGGEIELQIGSPRSPRSDGFGSPPADAADPSGLHHHQSQQHLRFRLFKRPGFGGAASEIGLGLGIRERRNLGNVLFLAFCGVCFLLGVGKIWAGGWFGDDRETDLKVRRAGLFCTQLLFLTFFPCSGINAKYSVCRK
jgi:hypothetical protein